MSEVSKPGCRDCGGLAMWDLHIVSGGHVSILRLCDGCVVAVQDRARDDGANTMLVPLFARDRGYGGSKVS